MELLVSGAVVFGLFRLPPLLGGFLGSVLQTTAGSVRLFSAYAYVFAAMAIYTLLACFLLHLGCRAFWIGLVGLESVFPEGVKWDRTPIGPHSRRHLKRILLPLDRQIERLDDISSLIFSFASMLVLNIAYSLLVIMAAGVAAFAISRLAFGGRHLVECFVGTAIALLAPPLLFGLADRSFGREAEGGRRPFPFPGGGSTGVLRDVAHPLGRPHHPDPAEQQPIKECRAATRRQHAAADGHGTEHHHTARQWTAPSTVSSTSPTKAAPRASTARRARLQGE